LAAWPIEAKVQQSGAWTETLKGVAREEGKQREVRRMFKMLREIWLNIGVEKVDTHEKVIVKALLDSSIIGMFIDRKIVARHGFKLQKLNRPIEM